MPEKKSHVIEVTEQGMSGQCDRCGAQAYVEVAMIANDLKFCSHHANENWDYIMSLGVMVADHRPFLAKQEEKLIEHPAVT